MKLLIGLCVGALFFWLAASGQGMVIAYVFAGFFYLLPGLNAYNGGNRNARAILLLNILLGWTVLGWVGALIWSEIKEAKPA